MTIHIASDHAGFLLKNTLKEFLQELGYQIVDYGANDFNSNDDYPDFIHKLALVISESPKEKGIIIGGSGQGEAIVANRYKNVRAVVYYGEASNKQTDIEGNDLGIIESSVEHNDANILSLGARYISTEKAKEAVKLFLETLFSGQERHLRRIGKIDI